jgi:hypothetical protein
MERSPIVIEPLVETYSLLTFTCRGDGLRIFECTFDPDVASKLPLLSPVLTHNGRVAASQPSVPSRGMSWWRAQCAFRGLPHTGRALRPLQDALWDAVGKEMLPEFIEMEKRLNKEFLIKNAAARDEMSKKQSGLSWKEAQAKRKEAEAKREREAQEKLAKQAAAREEAWKTLDTDEKAEEDLYRLLRETFPSDGPEREAIIIKNLDKYSRQELHIEAIELGLRTASTDAPKTIESDDGESSDDEPKRWIVIGRKTAHVSAKIQEIQREAIRAYQQWQETQDDDEEEAHAAIISDLRRGALWDVTGFWRIKCPKIEDNYDAESLSFDIYHDWVSDNLQMFGEFDFGIVKGVLRFQKPAPARTRSVVTKGKRSAASGTKEETDDDGKKFHLWLNDEPSPRNPTWNFRWRGEETGESEIQRFSDQRVCSVTFSGPGGCELTGVFHNEYASDCTFSGRKIDTDPRGGDCDIERRWQDYSEDAYHRARRGRWHR